MAGFRLGNTLSDNGSVTRGLCHITDGKLTGVTETHNIFKTADGAESREDGQPAEKLDLNELVSMNMWGLTPAFMDTLYDGFVEFLQNVKAGDIKAEYLLPVMIDTLIQKGTAQVDVLETKDTWFGVTYQEDKEVVIKAFKELTEVWRISKRTLQIRLSDTVYCNCLQFCFRKYGKECMIHICFQV